MKKREILTTFEHYIILTTGHTMLYLYVLFVSKNYKYYTLLWNIQEHIDIKVGCLNEVMLIVCLKA